MPPTAKEFNVAEVQAHLTLVEMWARSARENLIMNLECTAAQQQSSNLIAVGSAVLEKIQSGKPSQIPMADAQVAAAKAKAHMQAFEVAMSNTLIAGKRLQAIFE